MLSLFGCQRNSQTILWHGFGGSASYFSFRKVEDLPPTFIVHFVVIAISSCWLSMSYAQDADWPEYLGGKERKL